MRGRTLATIRARANDRCEYCQLSEMESRLRFMADHIVSLQHGGRSTLDNLALACPSCNLHKGPNLTSIDPVTKRRSRLFHPRRDRWSEHFYWNGAILVGRTPIGRATLRALAINDPARVAFRIAMR